MTGTGRDDADRLRRDRKDRLSARRRMQIIAATSELICRNGVDGTRLKDVADEAGVSLGLIQHYFRHRNVLVAETISAMLELSLATWRQVQHRESDPVRRLVLLLRYQTNGWAPFAQRWSFWIEFWSAASRDDEIRALAKEIYSRWAEPFDEIIREGVKQGAFRPTVEVEQVVLRLMALVDGAAVRVLMDPASLDDNDVFGLLLETAHRDLGIDSADLDEIARGVPRHITTSYPLEPTNPERIDWTPLDRDITVD